MSDFIGVSLDVDRRDPTTQWNTFANCLRVSHPREITYPFQMLGFEMDTIGIPVVCRIAVMLYRDVNGDGETLNLVEGSVMPFSSQPSKRIIEFRQSFEPGRYALGFWTEKSISVRINSGDFRERADYRPICRKRVTAAAWPSVLTVGSEEFREQFPRVIIVIVPDDPTVPDPGPTPLGPFLGADLMEKNTITGWDSYSDCVRISRPRLISSSFRLSELRIDLPGVDSVKKPTRITIALYKKTGVFTYRIVEGSKMSLLSLPSKQILHPDVGFPTGEYCLGIWFQRALIVRVNNSDRTSSVRDRAPCLRGLKELPDVADVSSVDKREAFPRIAVMCKRAPLGFAMVDEDGPSDIDEIVVIMDELLGHPPDIVHPVRFVNSSTSPTVILPRALLLDSPFVAEVGDIALRSTTPLPSTQVVMAALLGSTPKLEDLHTLYNFFDAARMPGLAYVCCAYVKKLVTEVLYIPRLGTGAIYNIPDTADVTAFDAFSLAVLHHLGTLLDPPAGTKPPLDAVVGMHRLIPKHILVLAWYSRHMPKLSAHRMFSGILFEESFSEYNIGLFTQLYDERYEPTVILVASGGGLVPAHLEVLLTRSKYFRNIMKDSSPQKRIYMRTGQIEIPELEVDVLRAYLEFIYLGQLRELKGESALHMLLKLLTYASRVGDTEFMAFATPSISSILRQMSIIETMQVTLSSGALLLYAPDEVRAAWKTHFARRMHDSFSGVDGFTRTLEAMSSIMDTRS